MKQAKYTVQFIIAGHAMPEGRDVEYFASLAEIKRRLADEHEDASWRGTGGHAPSEAVIFKGRVRDVTDVYPDYVAITGPRGGVRIENC